MNDNCPDCCRPAIAPAATRLEGESLVCGYVCPGCGHRWATSWLLAAISELHDYPAVCPPLPRKAAS